MPYLVMIFGIDHSRKNVARQFILESALDRAYVPFRIVHLGDHIVSGAPVLPPVIRQRFIAVVAVKDIQILAR